MAWKVKGHIEGVDESTWESDLQWFGDNYNADMDHLNTEGQSFDIDFSVTASSVADAKTKYSAFKSRFTTRWSSENRIILWE